MIKGLHHNAYRCRDSEETRRFYEDFLGLPLAARSRSTRPRRAQDQRPAHVLPDGRRLVPRVLRGAGHAVRVQGAARLRPAHRARGRRATAARHVRQGQGARASRRAASSTTGSSTRSTSAIPNGYVIELTAKTARHAQEMDPATNGRARSSTAGRPRRRRTPRADAATPRPVPRGTGRPSTSRGPRWPRSCVASGMTSSRGNPAWRALPGPCRGYGRPFLQIE